MDKLDGLAALLYYRYETYPGQWEAESIPRRQGYQDDARVVLEFIRAIASA